MIPHLGGLNSMQVQTDSAEYKCRHIRQIARKYKYCNMILACSVPPPPPFHSRRDHIPPHSAETIPCWYES